MGRWRWFPDKPNDNKAVARAPRLAEGKTELKDDFVEEILNFQALKMSFEVDFGGSSLARRGPGAGPTGRCPR